MKSFAVTLVIWGALFALLWSFAHELFYPPGDWIAALVVSFLGALGIGGFRKARLERKDARIVAGTRTGPVDGKRTAVVGTLEPVGELLTAPFSGQPCVIYDYEISHLPEKTGDDNPSAIIDRGGLAMAPCLIRSGEREVRLLAYPGLEDFDEVELEEDEARERAKAYVAATQFESGSIVAAAKAVPKILEDRSGSVRADFRNTDFDDLDRSCFKERRVPAGAQVCVVGFYSDQEKAILPQANVGGVRMIAGTRQDALRSLRYGGIGATILGVFLIAVPGPVAYGLLSLRERYNEEHHLPSVKSARLEAFHKSVAEGDAEAVRETIERGVDVNAPGRNGYPALALASSAVIATMLLDAGARVDQMDGIGYTPLMLQSRDGRVDVVRVLLARGADFRMPARSMNANALDIAIDNGQEAVAKVLREAGAEASR